MLVYDDCVQAVQDLQDRMNNLYTGPYKKAGKCSEKVWLSSMTTEKTVGRVGEIRYEKSKLGEDEFANKLADGRYVYVARQNVSHRMRSSYFEKPKALEDKSVRGGSSFQWYYKVFLEKMVKDTKRFVVEVKRVMDSEKVICWCVPGLHKAELDGKTCHANMLLNAISWIESGEMEVNGEMVAVKEVVRCLYKGK